MKRRKQDRRSRKSLDKMDVPCIVLEVLKALETRRKESAWGPVIVYSILEVQSACKMDPVKKSTLKLVQQERSQSVGKALVLNPYK